MHIEVVATECRRAPCGRSLDCPQTPVVGSLGMDPRRSLSAVNRFDELIGGLITLESQSSPKISASEGREGIPLFAHWAPTSKELGLKFNTVAWGLGRPTTRAAVARLAICLLCSPFASESANQWRFSANFLRRTRAEPVLRCQGQPTVA